MSEIRVVHARGDGFARGMQVGAELQDLIQSSIAFYHRYLDRRGVSSEQLQDLLTPYLVAAETAYPDMMNVLKGMSVAALGEQVLRIEHIGSTSVPGLAAKPVIDISVGLVSMEPRAAYVPALRGLGYRTALDPSEPDHEFASRDLDGERGFHVHLCLAGSPFERRHLAFRDRLRTHQRDAADYADLKRRLAATHPNDVHTYTEGKSGFIRAIEAEALAAASKAV